MKDKHGWVKIVEAFVAILLIVGVVLVILNKGYIGKEDISSNVYDTQISILREIQRNDTMREEILNTSEESLPVEWEDTTFPAVVRNRIIERTPNYLECIGKICEIDNACSLTEKKDKEVYAQSVAISPTPGGEEVYRKLNLFCWIE